MDCYYISLYDLLKTRPASQHAHIEERYLFLLSHLSVVQDLKPGAFLRNVEAISKMGVILLCMIKTEDESDIQIAGTATAVIEPKLIRGGRPVCHIEDVVVAPEWRGKQVASTLLHLLSNFAKHHDCYKVMLDCQENLAPFYKKQGLASNGDQHMVVYL